MHTCLPKCRTPISRASYTECPLPIGWSHCYHASFEKVSLRVAVSYEKDGSPTQLPMEAQVKHMHAIWKDDAQIKELLQASQGAKLVPMADFREHTPFPASSEEQDSFIASQQSASSQERTVSIVSTEEDDTSKPIPPLIAVVSYDLAAVSSLEDPQDLLAEVKLVEAYAHCYHDAISVPLNTEGEF